MNTPRPWLDLVRGLPRLLAGVSLTLAFASALPLTLDAAATDDAAGKLREAAKARARWVAEETPANGKEFTRATQTAADAFTKVELKASGSTETFVKVTLNNHGTLFDGIRFSIPKGEPRDMAWAFAAKERNLPSNWYIMPRAGEMHGFRQFFRPDGALLGAPWASSSIRHLVFAQPLTGGELKPEQEYLIWFNFYDSQPKEIYILIKLVPVGTDCNSSAAIHRELDLRYK